MLYQSEIKRDNPGHEQKNVSYNDRYNLLSRIFKCSRKRRAIYLIIYLDKIAYLMEVVWLEKAPTFTRWVEETPPDSPNLKFMWRMVNNSAVLKTSVEYQKLLKRNRVTTLFEPVQKPLETPEVPTFFSEEPC